MMCCWQSQENVLVHYVRCNACAWPWAQRPKINNTGQCACLKPHHRRFERIWFKSCADFALLFIMLPFGQLHQYSRHMSAAAAVGPTTNDQKSKIARYFRSEFTKHEEVHVVFSAHATSSIRSDYLHLYLFPSMGLEKIANYIDTSVSDSNSDSRDSRAFKHFNGAHTHNHIDTHCSFHDEYSDGRPKGKKVGH